MRIIRLTGAVLWAAAALVIVGAGVSGPAGAHSPKHFSDTGVTVSFTLAPGTQIVYSGADVDDFPVTVTCDSFSASATVPATGLTIALSAPPAVGDCSDNFGGTDIPTTSGSWTVRLNSHGTKVFMETPQDGWTFTSSALTGCTVTLAPSGPAIEKGRYNDLDTGTWTNVPYPTTGSGCTVTGNPVFSATIDVSPDESAA